MKSNSKSRSWLITRVNSGFGRHMAEQLLARGERVAGTVRKMEAMSDLKAMYGELLWLGCQNAFRLSKHRRKSPYQRTFRKAFNNFKNLKLKRKNHEIQTAWKFRTAGF